MTTPSDRHTEQARRGRAALDVAEKVIEDVKHAADAVCDAVVSGVAAVQNAWDNLDPGLKQWIINGAAFAISFIPIAGPWKRQESLSSAESIERKKNKGLGALFPENPILQIRN